MLQNTFDSESDKKSSTSSTEEKVNEIFVKQTKSDLESSQEHIKRSVNFFLRIFDVTHHGDLVSHYGNVDCVRGVLQSLPVPVFK